MKIESDYLIDAQRLIALNPAAGQVVLGRQVPENVIFQAELDERSFKLTKLKCLISQKLYPQTADDHEVAGYEDPTYLLAHLNPFAKKNGLICTQTFRHDGQFGTTEAGEPLASNIVYFDLVRPASPQSLLSPFNQDIAQLGKHISMFKEAEIYQSNQGRELLFEYVKTPPQNGDKKAAIGIGNLTQTGLENIRPLLDPNDYGFEHFSTCGPPFLLDNTLNLFINARKNRAWNVYLFKIPKWCDPSGWILNPEPIILLSDQLQIGYGNQKIIFGSGFKLNSLTRELDLFYHTNDLEARVAKITI